MRKLFFAMLALTALASCSKDEVVQLNQDEIKFSVVTENNTKAEAVYCANNYMSSFNVVADHTVSATSKVYIKGDKITVATDGKCSYTETRYWPSEGSLSFYAIVNGEFTESRTPGNAPTITSFVVDDTVSTDAGIIGHKDLMYSVEVNKTKSKDAVALNFRHALSLIEFKAQNLNENLYVEISGVKVGRVKSTGTYTLPESSTSTQKNNNDHTNAGTATLTRGNWSNLATPHDYTIEFSPIKILSDVTNLTGSTDANDANRNFNRSLLLIPPTETTTAWNPASPSVAIDTDSDSNNDFVIYNGTYLAVKCAIYNISGTNNTDETIKTNDVKLYDGYAYIPVSFSWEEGKKYTYIFKFDTGSNGGKEPVDPTDPSVTPEDVLTPISYSLTIDDFQSGASYDTNLNI